MLCVVLWWVRANLELCWIFFSSDMFLLPAWAIVILDVETYWLMGHMDHDPTENVINLQIFFLLLGKYIGKRKAWETWHIGLLFFCYLKMYKSFQSASWIVIVCSFPVRNSAEHKIIFNSPQTQPSEYALHFLLSFHGWICTTHVCPWKHCREVEKYLTLDAVTYLYRGTQTVWFILKWKPSDLLSVHEKTQ